MTKSNTTERNVLNLILCAQAIANIADNAGSSPATSLWWSLHTADPGDTGTQGTSEASFTGYARTSIARTTAGIAVSTSDGTASPVAAVTFPQATSTSTGTITHAALGMTSATTAGIILYSGAVSPNVNYGQSVTISLTTATVITED